MSNMFKNQTGLGKRKIIIPIIMVVALLIGCGSRDAEKPPDQVIVLLKWIHQAQFAGCYVAAKKGFYARENIDITLNPAGPKVPPAMKVASLVSGKSHFAVIGAAELLKARALGESLVAVAVIFQKNPYVYTTLKGSGLHRPRDFKGKKIMVPAEGRTQHYALLRKLGITESDITHIPYMRDVNPLASGQIDAHMVYRTGLALAFEEKGLELEFIWVDDYGLRFYSDTIVTTEQLVRQNPELVERFLRATLDGWRYAIENQAEAVDMTLQFDPTLTKDGQMRMMKSQIPLIHTGEARIGWMDKNVWEKMQETLDIESTSAEKVEIDNAFTMDFLNRIYGKLK